MKPFEPSRSDRASYRVCIPSYRVRGMGVVIGSKMSDPFSERATRARPYNTKP